MVGSIDWNATRIGALGQIITGGTPPSARPECFGSEFPFITPTDLQSGERDARCDRFLSSQGAQLLRSKALPPGSVCFTCIGATIGKACITTTESFTNQQINSIIVDTDWHDPFFVFYLLAANADAIKAQAGGAATPILNKSVFGNILLPVPALPIQQRVGAVLSAFDDLVKNNMRRIRILEEMAQAIYREWFVQFRYPGHAHVPLVDSDLGQIPEGWEASVLGDVIELAYGKALKADDRIAGAVPVFGSSGVVGWHNVSLVDGPGVVVGRKGNVGAVYLSDVPFYPIDTTYYVRSKLPMLFIYFALSGMAFIDSHAAVPGLSRDQANRLPLLVPGSSVLDSFIAVVDPVVSLARTLELANANLRSTRDLLLPRLISGEIDVSGLEVPEVV